MVDLCTCTLILKCRTGPVVKVVSALKISEPSLGRTNH